MEELDTSHLLCPMPVIKLQKRMELLTPTDRIRVRATDPGVLHDIPAWCRIHGHQVMNVVELEEEILIDVEYGGADK